MKANELRIGNYVEKSIKSGQGRKLIDKIRCEDIVRIFENTGSLNYEPIPITEEWLVKFGFSAKNYSGHNAFHIINTWEIGNIFINQYDWGFKTDFLRDCDIELKHVHQLQNLYFALTGCELTITNLG